jgi:hypothetical protein
MPPVPESGAAAEATIQAITDQQILDTQAGNQTFFEQLDSVVNPPASGFPWWVWLAGGVAAFALVAGGSGSPRRYGR